MKKLLVIALALGVCLGAGAQEKKKGGKFMNALKKGVESTTGLDVSKEALFVYPEIGKWKMSVISCTGNPETGEVATKIAITCLFNPPPRLTAAWCIVTQASVPGGGPLKLEYVPAEPMYDLIPQKAVEVTLKRVLGVPTTASTLNYKFWVDSDTPNRTFELRDCPIEWITPPAGH